MKKLNFNKLSDKQVQNIMLKAAFSNFIKSLKISDHWKCCNITYTSLPDIHKHVSFQHMDVVKCHVYDLQSNLKSENFVKIESPILENAIEFACKCSSNKFIVILFYHYVKISYDLKILKDWQVCKAILLGCKASNITRIYLKCI